VLTAILAILKSEALVRSKKKRRGREKIERRGWEEEVEDEGQ
jgi:hypothetical protein